MPLQENSQDQVLFETTNIAPEIDEETLKKIGEYVVQIYEEDLDSRSEWEERNEEWIKLSSQVVEEKSYPWPGAANVKYPLLSTSALQFHARAYPALIPDNRVVKTRIFGADPDNRKFERSQRVSEHMSYQLLEENDDWQEDMDRLLYILPITGLAYKKSYFSPLKNINESKLVLPDDLVINYYAEDYERAIKTHRLWQNENEVYEYIAAEHYVDIDLSEADKEGTHEGVEDDVIGLDEPMRNTTNEYALDDEPYLFLEQHGWWDLDEDGYKEPYIITVEASTKQVVRMTARWDVNNVLSTPTGDIIKITPIEYFTQYGFFPNPDSKMYPQGFGALLGPINAASNTLLNILIDSGHLATLQGGFLGKGVRSRGGKIKFKPGHWQQLQTTGEDLRKNIYPLPIKEPSNVLFQLLGMLIQAGERLSSVKDIMVGENPGQNQPYATTVAVLEQGMKVFVGIYKRLYRSLSKEYNKLFRLNSLYLSDESYFNFFDTPESRQIKKEDYSIKDIGVAPNADTSIVSEAHKMMKADSLLQKKMAGLPLNTAEVTKRVIMVEGHEDVEALLNPDPPQEDPKVTIEKMKLSQTKEIEMAKIQVQAHTTRFEGFKDLAQAMSHLAKAAATEASVDQENFRNMSEYLMNEYKNITDRANILQQGILAQQQNKESPSTEETSTE